MTFRFALGLWRDSYGPDPAPGFMRGDRDETWRMDFTAGCALYLTVDEREYLGHHWNLGPLPLLLGQLEAAHVRLSRGQYAVVRSGVDDQPIVPYLRLEATPEGGVRVSLFFIHHPEHRYDYPIDRVRGMGERLYAFLDSAATQIQASCADDEECFTVEIPSLHDFMDSLEVIVHQAELLLAEFQV